jgi:hypothetical protein
MNYLQNLLIILLIALLKLEYYGDETKLDSNILFSNM